MAQASTAQDTNDTTDTTTPSNPAVEKAEIAKQIAELEKATAEAELATLKAKLPTSDTTGPEGKVEFKDKTGYFAELQAYEVLETLASQVATEVAAPSSSEIILTANLNLSQQAALWEILRIRLEDFRQQMEKLDGKYKEDHEIKWAPDGALEVAAIPAILPSLLGAAADIAAFFRSDTTVYGREFTLADNALLAQVAKELPQGWAVFLPTLSLAQGKLVGALPDLLQKRWDLAQRKKKIRNNSKDFFTRLSIERAKLNQAQNRLEKLKAAKPPDEDKIETAKNDVDILKQKVEEAEDRWNRFAAEFDELLTAFDAFVQAMTQGADGKPSPLEAVAVIDHVKAHPEADILYLDIASQGGEIHVTRSAWTSRITYLGGAVVSYFQFSKDGSLRKSGTIQDHRAESKKAKEAAKLGKKSNDNED